MHAANVDRYETFANEVEEKEENRDSFRKVANPLYNNVKKDESKTLEILCLILTSSSVRPILGGEVRLGIGRSRTLHSSFNVVPSRSLFH